MAIELTDFEQRIYEKYTSVRVNEYSKAVDNVSAWFDREQQHFVLAEERTPEEADWTRKVFAKALARVIEAEAHS